MPNKEWEDNLAELILPRWDELPEIDIYMDQLVQYVIIHTSDLKLSHSKDITPSMINNYVKLKLVPKPHKKKYGRNHLARIMVITILKQAFEIPAIKSGIEFQIDSTDSRDAYNFFCDHLEATIKYFILKENESTSIDHIKHGYTPIQMACTTFIAKLITENSLNDLLTQNKLLEEN
ncbi:MULTISPECIES: DUF1836 domain-containing protein [Vagococcus]|uniref:DUF1836 domain-containing protein n=1 Tax=Vagococcus fluvialis bH819 TaxID=1255619 RepID=A0A1X6WQT0_9ENTE|nr:MULTISPECIES: DUF1836 domain-containing protein [Vagococcus]SLM86701.1 hypothetical protein FM121_11440 [Vagococcus fluvialis bH819]HCM90909.1 DUF1836 domain-containing protein [Vagococcus sp.]